MHTETTTGAECSRQKFFCILFGRLLCRLRLSLLGVLLLEFLPGANLLDPVARTTQRGKGAGFLLLWRDGAILDLLGSGDDRQQGASVLRDVLEVLLLGIGHESALLRLAGNARKQDQLRLVLAQTSSVTSQRLLRSILASTIDGNANRQCL